MNDYHGEPIPAWLELLIDHYATTGDTDAIGAVVSCYLATVEP
jgi:hypothetical protein